MKAVSIERADKEDLRFVVSGIEEILRSGYSRSLASRSLTEDLEIAERRARKAIRSRRVIVARNNGTPIGFLWYEPGSATPYGVDYGEWYNSYYWVNWSYVAKRHRKRGIGSMLYDELSRICKKRGVKELAVTATNGSKRSHKFHRKVGFRELVRVYSKKI